MRRAAAPREVMREREPLRARFDMFDAGAARSF